MSACVVDASAILAYVFEERGAEAVDRWLDRGAAASALTVQETMSKLVEKGFSDGEAEEAILALGLNVVAIDTALAFAAGAMFPQTKPYGLSHGDRACLALGIQLDLPVVTADGNWSAVAPALKVRVEQFR